MTTRMPADVKEKLLAKGVWGEFVARREELVASGMSSAAARRQALGEFLDATDVAALCPKAVKVPKQADAKQVADQEVGHQTKPPDRPTDGVAPARMASPVVDEAVFAGKRCSRTAAADWAFENAPFEVGPEEAPSKLAWVLLGTFRKFPAFMQDVYKGILVKAVAREDVETGGPQTFDGQAEYDILKAMEEV